MNLSIHLGRGIGYAAIAVFIVSVVLWAQTAVAATLFSDGFESNNFAQWTQIDTGTAGMWRIDTSRNTGKYSALVIGSTGTTNDVLRKAFSTDTYSAASVSFFYKASSLDYKSKDNLLDRFFAEYSVDGKTWTLIKEINGKMTVEQDGSWRQVTASVPSHKSFQLRFRAHLSDSGDRVWIDDVVISGTPTENTLPRCTDYMDNDSDGYIDRNDPDCDAFFSDLTVVKVGSGQGLVTSAPAGIHCGADCAERYLSHVIVTLNAAVTRGMMFAGWEGACSGSGSCAVDMDADKTVFANFIARSPYTLTSSNSPADGGVITALGINCGAVCATTVYEGEALTITAQPNFGFEFSGWSGDCTGTESVCSLEVVGDALVTANYTALEPGMCGNMVIEWNETCDDGNSDNFDGCSNVCQVPTIECSGTVSYPICRIVF
ncbi:DUF4215 domain-containing protein [Patescibacteria group bacterium]|nr:DUF4215 domain-containing protein [Patescibacteria group bacterium]